MKTTILILLFSISSILSAQDRPTQMRLDSLETKLSKAKNDSVRLSILIGLGHDYAIYSNKKSLSFNEKTIELAKKMNKPMGIARAYENYSHYYQRTNDTIKETSYLNKIIALGKEFKDEEIIATGYFTQALSFLARNKPYKAREYLLKSQEISERLKLKDALGVIYLHMGHLHLGQFNDYNTALEYYRKYIDLFDKNDIRLANTHLSIANIYSMQSKYGKVLEYLKYADDLYKKNKETESYHYAVLLNNFANIYKQVKEYKKSIEYYDLALKYFLKTENYRSASRLYAYKADLYLKMNDTVNVFQNINLALEQTENATNCLEKEDSFTEIGYLYSLMENYPKALEFYFNAYRACPENTPYKKIVIQQYDIGNIYFSLSNHLQQIKNPSVELPKNKIKLLQLSENYLQKAKKRSQESQDLNIYTSVVNTLYQVYEAQGNKGKALEYYKEYITYKDSLSSIENRELLVQNQMQFEFDQKEKVRIAEQEAKDALAREELANEKSRRNMALGGIGVFVILAGLSGYAYTQKKKDNKIIAKEKQKSDDLLLNILPEEVANELKEKGSSAAQHFDSVSIMFTDFKDFTKLSEKIPSKELIEELNYCFKAFDEIVVKHGVEKIKTIGDSYMAVCGLPAKDGNHAQKMVQAAIEIRDFIEDYKIKRQKEGKTYFEMRIGINSGEVVAGIVGIKKFAYDIWGDAVNTASRMESNGAIGKINISESTYHLVKDDFDFEHRGEIETKGKGKINMYFVEKKTI